MIWNGTVHESSDSCDFRKTVLFHSPRNYCFLRLWVTIPKSYNSYISSNLNSTLHWWNKTRRKVRVSSYINELWKHENILDPVKMYINLEIRKSLLMFNTLGLSQMNSLPDSCNQQSYRSVLKTFRTQFGEYNLCLSACNLSEQSEGDFVGKYTTPAGLTEYYTECTPQQRPLVVLHYIHNLKFRQVLCFTNSVESTHRWVD